MNKSIFLIVSSHSGAGKTTIVNKLVDEYGYSVVDSYTTRPKRTPDETGHTFVSKEEFALIKDICAYTEIEGEYYGATSEQVDNADLYVIDALGIEYFLKHYSGDKWVYVIHIDTDRETAYKRMLSRPDDNNEETFKARIKEDERVLAGNLSYANLNVVNGKGKDLNYVCSYIDRYIKAVNSMIENGYAKDRSGNRVRYYSETGDRRSIPLHRNCLKFGKDV